VARELGRRIARALRPPERRASVGLATAAAALTLVRCTTTAAAPPAPDVQVLLARGSDELRVSLDGAYVVADERGSALASGRRLVGGRIRADGDRLELNGVGLPASTVVLRPTGADRFRVGDRSYAGDLRVRRAGDGRLELVNVLDIEEYLAGVLFSEMPAGFPEESLRAQAVAARTYARWRLANGDALLRATDADQVYGGATALHERARALVGATRGLVLEVNGRPLPAYFMSTCGGATTDAPLVFSGSPRAGLTGVRCEWCSASPKYRWSRSIATPEFARRLGASSDPLTAVTPQRDALGHSIRFEVTTGSRSRTLDALEFRRLWNAGAANDAERLPSGWLLALNLTRSTLSVQGAGFGHGVGMCQYGAAGLAKAGRNWREIVHYYYRGAELAKRW